MLGCGRGAAFVTTESRGGWHQGLLWGARNLKLLLGEFRRKPRWLLPGFIKIIENWTKTKTWFLGVHFMSYQICGDQDIGLRFEDTFGCWMQFINKRRLHGLKSFIWCICTASEIERETSFFPISIHTMWIGKLSLWSLRSNPLPPHNPSQDQELVEWNQKVCVGLSHLYSFYPALDSRENPFIKLDSDLFSRCWLWLPSLFSLCTLPRSKSWQRRNLQWTMGPTPSHLKLFERVGVA